MPNYEKMYHTLFNSVTNAIEILQKAQIEVENQYLDSCEIEDKTRKVIQLVKKEESEDV